MTPDEEAALESAWAASAAPTRTEKVAALAAASGLTLDELKAELGTPDKV